MRKMRKVAILSLVLSLLVVMPAAPAVAWDFTDNIKNLGDGLAAAVGGEVINGGRSWLDEVQKRDGLGVITGLATGGLNIAITVVNSGLTLGTLGFVPVVSNGYQNGPPLPFPR